MSTISSSSKSNNNPFKLQSDNKKFFTSLPNIKELEPIEEYSQYENGLNRIKNMNKELEEMAKRREEMMFKEAQIDYIFKKQKPKVSLNDFITSVPGQGPYKDKKFRVRALLKGRIYVYAFLEKKESVHDFLEKKKEIYLSKMNINIKKQETIKLSDYIKDEEETLKARKLYFDNDVEFMHKFIEGIKKQAEDAQSAVESELKTQQGLVSKLNALEAETDKLDNLISKDTETLKNLKTYKEFIDSFYDPERNWKPFVRRTSQNQQVMFMTENISGLTQKDLGLSELANELIINFQPQNLLEIFNNAEENNIRQIQNLHDKEDELETIVKEENNFNSEIQKIVSDNEVKLGDLMRKYEAKQLECSKFKEMKKNNSSNKIKILDGENLDIEKISVMIHEIYKEIDGRSSDRKENEDGGEKGVKKAMTCIEQDIQKLRQNITGLREQYPQLIAEIEKEIKQNQIKQNIIRKHEEAKELELKKQREQQKKRNETHNEKTRGRKDMRKVIIEKKVKEKKKVDVKVDNEEQKYLADD